MANPVSVTERSVFPGMRALDPSEKHEGTFLADEYAFSCGRGSMGVCVY